MRGGDNWLMLAGFIGILFLAPTFLAKGVVGADWGTIAIAYAVWLALLGIFALLNLASGIKLDEAVGWPMIMSIFFTIPAIPVLAAIMRWTGLR